jgi:hypothetical protein
MHGDHLSDWGNPRAGRRSGAAPPAGPSGTVTLSTQAHLAACHWLIDSLQQDKNRTLAGLLVLLQKHGKCLGCGPEIIKHVAVNKADDLPVPLFDVRAGSEAGWDGVHLRFCIPSTFPKRWGHLIVRNLSAPTGPGLSAADKLELVRQHELFHVEESLSGAATDMLTAADLEFGHGFAELLPTFAARGSLGREEAFAMAGRFYLQHVKRELGAYGLVDYPYYLGKLGGGTRQLEFFRGTSMCMIVGFPLEGLAVGFIDPYSLDWRDWVESVAPAIDELAQGTFLEEAVLYAGVEVTPSDLLRSIEVSAGRIRDRSGGKMPFARLVAHLPRDGGFARYGGRRQKAVAESPDQVSLT